MAVIRRGRGSRSRITLAAGLLVVAALASMPARSATPPALVSTSVDNGWANGNFVLARFDQAIDVAGSTASVTEFPSGTLVAGNVTFASAVFNLRKDVIVWTADLTGRIDEFGAPLRALPEGDYRIDITAVSKASGLPTTIPTMSYKVDAAAPFNPIFTSPDADFRNIDVDPLSGELTITGVVSDRQVGTGFYKSGVARVMLYFYQASDPFSYDFVNTPGPGGQGIPTPQNLENKDLRRAAALTACGSAITGCDFTDAGGNAAQHDRAFSSTVTDIGPGLWTVKAIASDAAGNQSQEVTVSFLYLG